MARRSSLPGADELFRATSSPAPAADDRAPTVPADAAVNGTSARPTETLERRPVRELSPQAEQFPSLPRVADRADEGGHNAGTRPAHRSGSGVRRVSRAKSTDAEHQPSGRERHDEKITVYVSPQELLELERARWVLRAEHGLASDRGRIVREAVAVVLADLEAKGAHSILVTRLQELENR